MKTDTKYKMPTAVIGLACLGAVGLSLTGCNQSVEDAQEDVVEQRLEAEEDVLEERADLQAEIGNEQAAENLDEQADAMGEMADEVD